MQYSLYIKTDFGVPCCTVAFEYHEREELFRNIQITNLAPDIEYRVDTYFPVKKVMIIEAVDLFNSGQDDDYASDISISIPSKNKMNCQQINQCLKLHWNLQTIENNGTYELTQYV
jgi:hypothetical protein